MLPYRFFALALTLRAASANAPSAHDARSAANNSNVVEVVGRNYAFAVPAELPAGSTTFRFTNHGTVFHELRVALLNKGVTSSDVIAAVNSKSPLRSLVEASVGILLAPPGMRSATGLSTRLLPGRDYLVVCSFQDSASAPKHSQMGMVSVIHIRDGEPASSRAPATDTIIGSDYAFRLPHGMRAGAHRFAFVDSGRVNHEVNVALLRRGVRLSDVFAIAKRDGDLIPLIERWAGVLISVPGKTALGTLDMDLSAGRDYALLCQLTNDARSPQHVNLGMFGSIRVRR